MYAKIIKLEAKPDRAQEATAWLSDTATRLAQSEATIRDFYVVRASDTSFWIYFDTFETEADQHAHAEGPVAEALQSRAAELLSAPPDMMTEAVVACDETRAL